MTDELLPFYNRELAFIREMGAEFAKNNPKIAGRLRWSGKMSEDPHVSRMIEAFAFLNARIRHKLEDDFPELTESLLSVLYPHYLAPLPSCSILQCEIDRDQAEQTGGDHIARHSELETTEGLPLRFRTAYDLQLWPLEIANTSYRGEPFSAPSNRVSASAEAVVTVQLRAFSEQVTFSEFPLETLRLYLNGKDQYIHDLYELLLNDCMGIAVAADANDPNAVFLSPDSIQPVGFSLNEGLFEYSARSFLGYRLVSEYFAFPEKFMFVDVQNLQDAFQRAGGGRELSLYFYLRRHLPDLEQQIDRESLKLGCTPIVNLYTHRAEPIHWNQTDSEYRIIPDARRPRAHEVYSITRVIGTTPNDEQLEFVPFYSMQHSVAGNDTRAFWHSSRRRAEFAGGKPDDGTEVYLSLVDLNFKPAELANWNIDIELVCVNRDLPNRLDVNPNFQFSKGGSTVGMMECLTPPTPTHRPFERQQGLWRLISHLSLNHISLFDENDSAEALREILFLYDPIGSVESRKLIDGLEKVSSKRVVGRVSGGAAAGFCRGLEVHLQLDEDKFVGSGTYLFAAVLERFLALYCSLNSFTKTKVSTNQRQGVLCQWPPRAGEMVLS